MTRHRLVVIVLSSLTALALMLLVRHASKASRWPGKYTITAPEELFAAGQPARFGEFSFDISDAPRLHARNTTAVDYDRQIKPILSAACYACHGPARQRGKLRLDVRDVAVRSAIVPGNAKISPLMRRIASHEEDERMPPPEAKKPALSAEQVALIGRWIDDGARYDEHWSYVRPARPPVPSVANRAWAQSPIDAFIAAEHEARSLSPASQADRRTLIRRLYLDILGLPPTLKEVDRFLNDRSANAYEALVDRLLASPHYGERMAVLWLDLVRYADTDGYSVDADRRVSLYRDYVINAFNSNKRFDHFTIQQIAGDLLTDATVEDRIASGYNRILMNSTEGCAEPEERKVRYAADRVRNVSSVWLGLTMACAECHDHKFDPLTTKDFYSLGAFFSDIQEVAVGTQTLTYFPTSAQLRAMDQATGEVSRAIAVLNAKIAEKRTAIEQWERDLRVGGYKGVSDETQKLLQIPPTERKPDQQTGVDNYYASVTPEFAALNKRLKETSDAREKLEMTVPATLVTTFGPRREVRILPRGDWLNQTGPVVTSSLPAVLVAHPERLPAKLDRLDLARWLVSPQNPLTARVFVNRLWKMAFGTGLVASADDFGIQGTVPTHPELLDWLALEFMDSGWDVKATLKLILMSRTYQQASTTSTALHAGDPANSWLTRQNRFRLDAEFIRDNALTISGLFTPTVGGDSVKPYQPDGYWVDRHVSASKGYEPDKGIDQYRRGLYTFWCRNYLHPSLLLFDAPARQSCTGARVRSATPLQALVLLNDPTYGEAARAFASRVLREAVAAERFNYAFQLALARPITTAEQGVLAELYAKEFEHFCHHKADAVALLGVGASPLPAEVDVAELAAWTTVTRVILNLRETITRY